MKTICFYPFCSQKDIAKVRERPFNSTGPTVGNIPVQFHCRWWMEILPDLPHMADEMGQTCNILNVHARILHDSMTMEVGIWISFCAQCYTLVLDRALLLTDYVLLEHHRMWMISGNSRAMTWNSSAHALLQKTCCLCIPSWNQP